MVRLKVDDLTKCEPSRLVLSHMVSMMEGSLMVVVPNQKTDESSAESLYLGLPLSQRGGLKR